MDLKDIAKKIVMIKLPTIMPFAASSTVLRVVSRVASIV